mgnify:CR=1 FL=1
MFWKTASAEPLGIATLEGDRFAKIAMPATAASAAAAGDSVLVRARSYYLDGAATIDVRSVLEEAAEKYALSADPRDYVFEAIRACTSNAPNDNNDAFRRVEKLRFDLKAGVPVYQTFVRKPHHLDHRTNNPKAARGVILDAHYNDEAPALEVCPRRGCGTRTAERTNRDPEDGLHCRKCGALCRDEFTEILVGIDQKKDPFFADNVRRGVLRAGSMGCNCESTVCNVCQHVAYSRPEFCAHIQGANKGTLWIATDRGDWQKISYDDARSRMAKAGLELEDRDFCYIDTSADHRTATSGRGLVIRRAYENCAGVIFDEYSRVHTPADPKAVQREILRAARLERQHQAFTRTAAQAPRTPTLEELRRESELLVYRATHPSQEPSMTFSRAAAAHSAPRSRTAAKFVVVRVDGDDRDTHAGKDLDEALALAAPDSGSTVEQMTVEAPDAGAARLQTEGAAWSPVDSSLLGGMDAEADITLAPPAGERLIIEPPESGAPGEPPALPGEPPGGGMSIEDLTDQQVAPPGQPAPPPAPAPGRPGAMSPAEVGILPPGASRGASAPSTVIPLRGAFARAYGDWSVFVTDTGATRIETPDQAPALVIPSRGGKTAEAHAARGRVVLAHLLEHGLLATAEKFGGAFSPRLATSVIDGAADDMADFSDKNMVSEVAPGDPSDDMDLSRDTPSDTTTADDADDMAGARGTPPSAATDDAFQDHALPHDPPDGVAEEDHPDMRSTNRRAPSLRGDSVLDNEIHDHQEPLAGGRRKATGALGEQLEHRGQARTRARVVAAALSTAGPVYTLRREDGATAEIKRADLLAAWAALDQPSPKAAAGAVHHAMDDKCAVCGAVDCKDAAHQKQARAPAPVSTSASASSGDVTVAARYQRWAKGQVDKAKTDAATSAVETFKRALRVAARRQLAGIEPSPMRDGVLHVLGTRREVGQSPDGQPLIIDGADPAVAQHLAGALLHEAYEPDLERLVARASELATMGDSYLVSAEADLAHVEAAPIPRVVASFAPAEPAFDEPALRAEALRRQASAGNFTYLPGQTPPQGSGVNGHDRRAAIRGVVGNGTLVGSMLHRLGGGGPAS